MDTSDLDRPVPLEAEWLPEQPALPPSVCLAAVDCTAAGDRWTLSFVRHLAGTPDDVWLMLTDPAKLQGWSPYLPDRHLNATGPVTCTLRGPSCWEAASGQVTCAEPPRALECVWPEDRIRWHLCSVGAQTVVTLRHTFLERSWAADAAADWHLCLDAAQRLLAPAASPDASPGEEGGDAPPARWAPDDWRWEQWYGDRWDQLCAAYAGHLGFTVRPDRR